MANLFANLPHLLGSITNLDGVGSARSLASIRAELQKLPTLFWKIWGQSYQWLYETL